MLNTKDTNYGLSGNQLKILAAIFMFCDHVGFFLARNYTVYTTLRYIGRLSFPIFAFFIAEGCYYTKNKLRYFLMMAGCAVITEIVFLIAEKFNVYSPSFSIFATFCFGILAVYSYEFAKKSLAKQNLPNTIIGLLLLAAVIAAVILINLYVREIEYGLYGVLLTLLVYAGTNKYTKAAGAAVACVGIAADLAVNIQYFALLSIPFLLLYNGKRGKYKLKYFFYIFYPAHIIFILLIGMIMG